MKTVGISSATTQITFASDAALLKEAIQHAKVAKRWKPDSDLFIGLFVAGYQYARRTAKVKRSR